jgi:hypothetical protein
LLLRSFAFGLRLILKLPDRAGLSRAPGKVASKRRMMFPTFSAVCGRMKGISPGLVLPPLGETGGIDLI